MIVFVSDFDMRGSGYMGIAISLCNQLAVKHGRKVTALGIGYNMAEHRWPFSLIPVQAAEFPRHVPAMIHNFRYMASVGKWDPVEAIVVAMDIPIQEKLLQMERGTVPYIGIFPVESGPLCRTWATSMSAMSASLVISEFGARMIQEAGVDASYLPIGIDTKSWRRSAAKERQAIRKSLGFRDDEFVVLTVCDNQERKNLSAAAEAISIAAKKANVKWMLVTRIESTVGWKLDDLAQTYGIAERMNKFDKGLPFDRLWFLYSAADAFLLTAKAEGLCALPGTTVITTEGLKPIESVQRQDSVLTHNGRYMPVADSLTRHYSGPIIVVEPSMGLEPLRVTPEHPILVAQRMIDSRKRRGSLAPRWIAASQIRPGDYLCWPTRSEGIVPRLQISQMVETIAVGDGLISREGGNQFGARFPHPGARVHRDDVIVDEDLAFLLGIYIAEGCWTAQGPDFSFHADEKDLQARLDGAMFRLFGLHAEVKIRERHRASMRYSDVMIGNFLSELCGPSSHEKHLPGWAMSLPSSLAWPLLEGLWAGDGTVQTRRQVVARYSTVSPELAQQMQLLLLRLGVAANIQQLGKRGYEVRISRGDFALVPFLKHHLEDDYWSDPPKRGVVTKAPVLPGFRLVRVKSISGLEYSGEVFNLEVEGDSSYVVAAGAVHNCLPILEAMACGVPVVATDCTAIPEHLFADPDWDRLKDGVWRKGHPKGQRGFPIPVQFATMDPWGNSMRSFADPKAAASILVKLSKTKRSKIEPMLEAAADYAASRTWARAGNVLEECITRATRMVLAAQPDENVGLPASVPRPVPELEIVDEQE